MTALFLTVLLASLLGSLHCAGMCGAFVAFAIGAGDPSIKTPRTFLLSLYQIGRLITYTLLGAVAGALGAGIDLGGRLVGLQRTAAILSGILMVAFGAITLARIAGIKLHKTPIPAGWSNLVAGANRRVMRYSPAVRATAIGLLTTLLPCGWLYAFVITAAGTGSALTGALLMATFWIGTLPMLTVIGIGARRLSGALATKLPALTASAVVIVGLYTIVARAGITLHGTASIQDTAALAHDIDSIDHTQLPCCTTQPAPQPEAHP